MLERLTETFIAGVELLEAEGRVARDNLVALTGTLLVLVACGVVGLVGLLAAAVGLTWLLAVAIGVGGALAIVGAALLAGSLVVGRLAVLRMRRAAPRPATPPEAPTSVPPAATAADGQPSHGSNDHLPAPIATESNHAAPFTTEDALPAALTRNPPPRSLTPPRPRPRRRLRRPRTPPTSGPGRRPACAPPRPSPSRHSRSRPPSGSRTSTTPP